MLEKLLNLDRRVIFLLMALAVVVPQLLPVTLPIHASQPARSMYDRIEALEPGTRILVSFDFDPASKPELEPMARAVLHHVFRNKLRLVSIALWNTGRELAASIIEETAREFGAEYGTDYAYLGWVPGNYAVIIAMGEDIKKTFPQEYQGKRTATLPILRGMDNLRDVPLVVTLAAGDPGIPQWVVWGKDKYGFDLAAGCTAVTAPAMYNYYMTGQLVGLLGGMKGAAEYEALVGRPGDAMAGMNPLSWMHFLVIGLIVFSNAVFFATCKGQRRR